MNNMTYSTKRNRTKTKRAVTAYTLYDREFTCEVTELSLEATDLLIKNCKKVTYNVSEMLIEEIIRLEEEAAMLRAEEEMLAMDPEEFSRWYINQVIEAASTKERSEGEFEYSLAERNIDESEPLSANDDNEQT